MEERRWAAGHILWVVSKAYWENPYSSWEHRAPQWAVTRKQPGYGLPVFAEDCKVPTLFVHLKRCDLYGLSEEDARARLRAFLISAAMPVRSSRGFYHRARVGFDHDA